MRRTVEWPADDKRDLAAYEVLDGPSRASVDTAPVPILIPAATVELDERRVMHGPEWAAFWGKKGELTISLHASRMSRVLPGVKSKPGTHTVREREGFITRNEGIWSASWIEYGVAYSLELECAPPDAPPCANDSTLVSLADGLAYVGGRGEEAGR